MEGNWLTALPGDMFWNLPALEYLDARNNRLRALPASIGCGRGQHSHPHMPCSEHQCLRTLLLQNNQLAQLPLELGRVSTIAALSLAGNPLLFPPPEARQSAGCGA